jgi:hypothetical protein
MGGEAERREGGRRRQETGKEGGREMYNVWGWVRWGEE